ncbi:MAG: DUF2203 domain-containing protein [Planctomyces sp.]|nr:DUF2203 domain-containing protein [Planctomyces sp.]
MPLVRAIAKDIVELYQDLLARHGRLQEMRSRNRRSKSSAPAAYREEVEQIQLGLTQDEQRLEAYVAELEALGVIVRDRSVGLIDFPSRIDGVDATLSWKLGEPEIAHWYGVGHQADVRSPLSPSLLDGQNSGANLPMGDAIVFPGIDQPLPQTPRADSPPPA